MLTFLKGVKVLFTSPVTLTAATTTDIRPFLTAVQPLQTENLGFVSIQLEVTGVGAAAAGDIEIELGKSLLNSLDDTQAEDLTMRIALNGTATERRSFVLDVRGVLSIILLNAINEDPAVNATLQMRIYADVLSGAGGL